MPVDKNEERAGDLTIGKLGKSTQRPSIQRILRRLECGLRDGGDARVFPVLQPGGWESQPGKALDRLAPDLSQPGWTVPLGAFLEGSKARKIGVCLFQQADHAASPSIQL